MRVTRTSLLLIICVIFLVTSVGKEAMAGTLDPCNGFKATLDLTFFNKSGEEFLGQTFRRYHLVTLGYEDGPFAFRAAYNWWDSVNGATSVHDLTPWMLRGEWKPCNDLTTMVEYWYVRNLVGEDDTQILVAGVTKQWRLTPCVTANLVVKSGNHYPIKLGGEISFNKDQGSLFLGYNVLPPLDEHYVEPNNGAFHAGLSVPLYSGTTLSVMGYHSMGSDSHPNTWVKSTLQFQIW